uniref:Indoleamine 2,3-dioxygenase 2 n=1 Tax=Crocodylus porosus TaxID=8502 RepID=A0A7M4DXP8_CROPO
MDPADETEQPPPPCALDKFHISPEYGFLLPDPQTELPAPYRPWMDLARSLPDLIATRQLRAPQLSAAQLHGHRDLRLAHLVLGFITAGYVWQDGEEGPVLPQNLAVPFWEVSRRLGLPPILLHADLVLANWRQRDRAGNLDPIVWLPGGESLRGFVLVTMLVEKAAVPGLQVPLGMPRVRGIGRGLSAWSGPGRCCTPALPQAPPEPACARGTEQPVLDPLPCAALQWATLPSWPPSSKAAPSSGLLYEGVWELPQAYSGGSAAQSTVLHAFDAFLGVRHHEESSAFLHRMRDYMPPRHRAFVEAIQALPPLRELVLSSGNEALHCAYNRCVTALAAFRTRHIAVATKYVAAPSRPEQRGTGGSPVLRFLKSVRDATREALLNV